MDRGKLETHYLLFVMKLSTREVCFAGRTRNPNRVWIQQVLRELSSPFDGFLRGCSHMIMDNDGLLQPSVVRPLVDVGIIVQRIPYRAPNCNAYIERFMLAYKQRLLDV